MKSIGLIVLGAAFFLGAVAWTVYDHRQPKSVTLCGVIEDVGGTHGQPVKITIAEGSDSGRLMFRFPKPQQVRMVICPKGTPFKDVASKANGLHFPQSIYPEGGANP